tara:strand:+ start:321 stop:620 length:300 start_codon:yes stop_codon:yes gene_type:complete
LLSNYIPRHRSTTQQFAWVGSDGLVTAVSKALYRSNGTSSVMRVNPEIVHSDIGASLNCYWQALLCHSPSQRVADAQRSVSLAVDDGYRLPILTSGAAA